MEDVKGEERGRRTGERERERRQMEGKSSSRVWEQRMCRD